MTDEPNRKGAPEAQGKLPKDDAPVSPGPEDTSPEAQGPQGEEAGGEEVLLPADRDARPVVEGKQIDQFQLPVRRQVGMIEVGRDHSDDSSATADQWSGLHSVHALRQ